MRMTRSSTPAAGTNATEGTPTAVSIAFWSLAAMGHALVFSVSGFIDTTRDRTDIQGTFVPAYGLNNVFSQVPIVGPLLGGGQHESGRRAAAGGGRAARQAWGVVIRPRPCRPGSPRCR